MLLPQVTSLVAVALIFTQLFDYRYGLVNYVLGQVGIGKVDWEAGTFSSWIALSVMVTWRWTGYNALIYLAAMQADPGRALRGRLDRRRQQLAAVLPHHDPDAAPDDHLHGHHLDDRRPAALHRAATCSSR